MPVGNQRARIGLERLPNDPLPRLERETNELVVAANRLENDGPETTRHRTPRRPTLNRHWMSTVERLAAGAEFQQRSTEFAAQEQLAVGGGSEAALAGDRERLAQFVVVEQDSDELSRFEGRAVRHHGRQLF